MNVVQDVLRLTVMPDGVVNREGSGCLLFRIEPGPQPQKKEQKGIQKEEGGQGKVKPELFPFIRKISREFTEPMQFGTEKKEYGSDQDEHCPNQDQHFSA
jgi:hypothetical protein